jgi:hypothetical protein
MKIPCRSFPVAVGLGIVAAVIIYFVFFRSSSGYRPGEKPGVKMFLQQDTSGMNYPITNNTGYRNPTIGLPIIPISTSSSIVNEILAPARAKSILPDVQETIIYRGPLDQAQNLPIPTTGAVMNNERALNLTHDIAQVGSA